MNLVGMKMLDLPLNPQIAQICLIIMQNVFLMSLSSSESLVSSKNRFQNLLIIVYHKKKSDEEEAELSFGEAQREQDPSVHEDILQDYSDLENPFGEAYITKTSSKRKQALRMRERPVLAIGRNNIVTGVAKTVKTHFKKHHLAIVNIKGRAKGTSVQEVIFEL